MDLHLEPIDPSFLGPMRGKVVEVVAKDDPRNPSGLTLYHVEVYRLAPPAQTQMLPLCPRLGDLGARGNEHHASLVVGQFVVVLFLEGLPEYPAICGVWPSQETSIAPTTADMAGASWRRNGVTAEMAASGDLSLLLKTDRAVVIKDASGEALLRLTKVGLGYEVQLGASASLKTLLTSDAIAAFNSHTHTETGATTSTPLVSWTSSLATTQTKAS